MIYTSQAFPISVIRQAGDQTRPKGNQKTKERRTYKNLICAFDIETTRIPEIEQSFMYIWQMQIESITIIGRTWKEFLDLMNRIQDSLSEDVYIVFWVHNLSYEFQFLRGIYPFTNEEVFAVDSRKILRCDMMNHFEFRCSYLQTNMSLGEFTHKMGIPAEKLHDFDYDKFRTPSTMLSPREIEYCVNDVKGLVQAMKKQMEMDGDNLYNIPRTSTGYVRREAKAAMRKFNRQWLRDMLPDLEVYELLRCAFRGGNTHANRAYTGRVLKNVYSADRSSSYPDCQVNDIFPMGAWRKELECSIDRLVDLCKNHRRAVLVKFAVWGVTLRDKSWGCPYLARAKCYDVSGGEYDNGRILCADYLVTTMTDVDFDIFLSEYDFEDIQIIKMFHARYGQLPKPLTDLTKKYYKDKTALKGDPEQEIYYMKQKNKLNSIYGMSVQCPTKPDILFDDETGFTFADTPEEELLIKANRNTFQSYAWGVWITAWARYRLEEGIRLAGSGFVYCDTDSVKYLKPIDWTAYNNERQRISANNGACAIDRKDVTHYMGVYEMEADGEHIYQEFITLGAKKYAYRQDGKLHITIAGVTKTTGADELEAAGGLEAFKPGFVFHKGGGTESIYNDHPEITSYTVPETGEVIPITSNVVIRDSTYELGLTAEYKRLIEFPEIWIKATTPFR